MLGHDVHDVAAERVQAELEGDIQAGDRAQIQAAGQVQAHGHAAAVDDDQAGGILLEAETVWPHLDRHVGKCGQAVCFAETEVQCAVEFDKAEHVDFQLAKDAQEGGRVVQHDGLEGVSGFDGVTGQCHHHIQHAIADVFAGVQAAVAVEVFTRIKHAVAPVFAEVQHTVAVGVFTGSRPGAFTEVDGGQRKAGLYIGIEADDGLGSLPFELLDGAQRGRVKVQRQVELLGVLALVLPEAAIAGPVKLAVGKAGQAIAGVVVPGFDDLANVQREARTQVDLQRDVARLHDHPWHAIEANFVDRGPTGQVDTNAHPLQRNVGLGRDQQAQVKVLKHHTDGARVDIVRLVNAAIVVAVVKVTSRLAIHNGRYAHEGVGIVDANGHGGDDGLFTIGQGDLFTRALGEGHGSRHLQHATQVDLGIADLGLDDFFIKVDENHVVAARWQRKAGPVDLAVLVAVFAELKDAVAVGVFARIQAKVVVQVFTQIQNAVEVDVFGEILERRTFLEVDGWRTEQLQGQVHRRRRFRDQEGVDVDFNVAQLGRQHGLVDAHQPGAFDAGLRRHPHGRVLLKLRRHGEDHGLEDGKTKVDVVDFQTHRAFVDVIQDAILIQIRTVAVGTADARKTDQVGTTQGHGLDVDVDVIQVHPRHITDVVEQWAQATRIDLDVVNLAFTEGQRAAQVHKVGQRNFGQADVQTHHRRAIEVQRHRLVAGAHHMANVVGGGDLQSNRVDLGLAGCHAAVNRHGAEQLQPLTTGVVFERDVTAQNFQEITKAIGAQLVGGGLDGGHALDRVTE